MNRLEGSSRPVLPLIAVLQTGHSHTSLLNHGPAFPADLLIGMRVRLFGLIVVLMFLGPVLAS